MSEDLKPCPFCGGEMQLRQALWPSDGDTDAIIHKAIQGGPDGACGMSYFSVGTMDEGITVSQAWNRRAPDPVPSVLIEVLNEISECRGWIGVPIDTEAASYLGQTLQEIVFKAGAALSGVTASDPDREAKVAALVKSANDILDSEPGCEDWDALRDALQALEGKE